MQRTNEVKDDRRQPPFLRGAGCWQRVPHSAATAVWMRLLVSTAIGAAVLGGGAPSGLSPFGPPPPAIAATTWPPPGGADDKVVRVLDPNTIKLEKMGKVSRPTRADREGRPRRRPPPVHHDQTHPTRCR